MTRFLSSGSVTCIIDGGDVIIDGSDIMIYGGDVISDGNDVIIDGFYKNDATVNATVVAIHA